MALDFSKYTKKQPCCCETCEFYQYDEYTDSYCCTMNLDEDEMVNFLGSTVGECHYYRYYDEYKSVQKQI